MLASSFMLTKVNSGYRHGDHYSNKWPGSSFSVWWKRRVCESVIWVCAYVCVCVCMCVYGQSKSPRSPVNPSWRLEQLWVMESLVPKCVNYLRCLHLCSKGLKGSTYSPQPLFIGPTIILAGAVLDPTESLGHLCDTFRVTLQPEVISDDFLALKSLRR